MQDEVKNRGEASSIDDIKRMISSTGLPDEVRQTAYNALAALSHISPGDADYESGRDYIDCLTSLPWDKKTKDNNDLEMILETLNESRLCSQNIRDRIGRHLTVKLLKEDKKLKILVVDDERIAVDSLKLTLTREGYSVVTAGSGIEAIEKLKEADFDLVITDLIMGDIDGQAVIKEIKNKYPDTGVIMITGYATVDTAVEALRTGAFHYIEKPIELDELRTAVRGALKHRLLSAKSNVLCFAGSSGAVMNELGKTIAKALGRKLQRISLAEFKDEADIRGRRRADGGVKPGIIMEEVLRSGCANPVLMLEGLDMTREGFQDNTAMALLEALDPMKNRNFTDLYIDMPFNLSEVIYIVTTNNADNIKSPLREILDIIEL